MLRLGSASSSDSKTCREQTRTRTTVGVTHAPCTWSQGNPIRPALATRCQTMCQRRRRRQDRTPCTHLDFATNLQYDTISQKCPESRRHAKHHELTAW